MSRHRKLKVASVIIISVVALPILLGNTVLPAFNPIQIEFTPTRQDNRSIDTIRTSTIEVDDIDITYKIFGTGPPILLINGFGGTMDYWPASFLDQLSSSHTVIIFDNRGIGNTTNGIKKFTIKQFAEDTVGLLNALRINRTDVMGSSMGGKIAQELILQYPDKVGKLVLASTYCGYDKSVPKYDKDTQSLLRRALTNSTFLASPEGIKLLAYLTYPEEYLKQKENVFTNILYYISTLVEYLRHDQNAPKNDQVPIINSEALQHQLKADQSWNGVCDKLQRINHPTLIITGVEDIVVPSPYSSILKEKIPGAKLVEIEGAGHGVIVQYPDRIGKIIAQFLKQGNIINI